MSVYHKNVTLRSLLENPELLKDPVSAAPEKVKAVDDVDEYPLSQRAFLGPNIWETTLSSNALDLNIENLDVLDFGDLLNGVVPNLADMEGVLSPVVGSSPSPLFNALVHLNKITHQSPQPLAAAEDESTSLAASFGHNATKSCAPATAMPKSCSPVKKSSNSASSFADALEESRCSTVSNQFCLTPDETSQMSGSGDESFDPSLRSFSDQELRIQPILKKSRKIFVPDDLKDDKYWARRLKNNTAAKRSREARRTKENQITMRTAFLEKENACLKSEVERLLLENGTLKSRLGRYETVG